MAKYTYTLQTVFNGTWHDVFIDSRHFCEGYMHGRATHQYPRSAMRIVRSDGKVVSESEAYDEANLGMIAGYPSIEQLEAAIERCKRLIDNYHVMKAGKRL